MTRIRPFVRRSTGINGGESSAVARLASIAAPMGFSINFFAWTGADFRRHFGGTDDDECYLSVQMPRELSRYNIICGNALASHFAYYTQRVLLDSTDILAKYKALAERQMSC
jgi:hypothetical protein